MSYIILLIVPKKEKMTNGRTFLLLPLDPCRCVGGLHLCSSSGGPFRSQAGDADIHLDHGPDWSLLAVRQSHRGLLRDPVHRRHLLRWHWRRLGMDSRDLLPEDENNSRGLVGYRLRYRGYDHGRNSLRHSLVEIFVSWMAGSVMSTVD